MDMDIKDLLNQYNGTTLQQIASYHQLQPRTPRNKELNVQQLTTLFTDPKHIQEMVQELNPEEKIALHILQESNGILSTRSLRDQLAKRKQNAPQKQAFGKRQQPFDELLQQLMLRGLVFNQRLLLEGNNSYGQKFSLADSCKMLFVPPQVLNVLPPPPEVPAFNTATIHVSQTSESSARVFQRDLYLYWSFVRDRLPAITMKDELYKTVLRDLNNLLLVRETLEKSTTENDYPRLRFIRDVLAELNTIAMTGERILTTSGQADFFALPPEERVKQTYLAWKSCPYDEFLQVKQKIEFDTYGTALLPAPAPVLNARKKVLSYLGRYIKNGWYRFAALSEKISEIDPDLLFNHSQFEYPYNKSAHLYSANYNPLNWDFPQVEKEEEGWAMVEATFIRAIIEGPLFWMGLVDLGWEDTAEGPADAFRLTALGAWIFGLGPCPSIPVEGGKVIVQPNMHIIALDPILDSVLITLDHFAERLNAERAVEYQLTRASVYAAQKAGWQADRILNFLKRQTGSDLPGNVVRTLEEWQSQHERITIRSQAFLVHGRPDILQKVEQDPAYKNILIAHPLPEVGIVADYKAAKSLMHKLQEQNILPVLNRSEKVAPKSVQILESGEIFFVARTPNLYLHGYLAPFADPEEDHYRLSAASVRRAARAGLKTLEIIQKLTSISGAPLPAGLERKLRIWGSHYSNVKIEETVLLQMGSAEELTELMQDEEIAHLLQKIDPPVIRHTVRVKPKNLEKLKALLAERGVELDA